MLGGRAFERTTYVYDLHAALETVFDFGSFEAGSRLSVMQSRSDRFRLGLSITDYFPPPRITSVPFLQTPQYHEPVAHDALATFGAIFFKISGGLDDFSIIRELGIYIDSIWLHALREGVDDGDGLGFGRGTGRNIFGTIGIGAWAAPGQVARRRVF